MPKASAAFHSSKCDQACPVPPPFKGMRNSISASISAGSRNDIVTFHPPLAGNAYHSPIRLNMAYRSAISLSVTVLSRSRLNFSTL